MVVHAMDGQAYLVSDANTEALKVGEQIKVRLRNDVQRFATELRGAVRQQEPTEDAKFLVGIELFSRLMPLDVMMLRRAGINDVTYVGKIWV